MAEELHFSFNEKKAAQVAARLVAKHGGCIKYLHLMKMLYAIDRIALAKWGQPVNGGSYYSLNKGPIISEALNLVKGKEPKGTSHPWHEYFETKGFDVLLKKTAGTEELSRAEIDLIDTVFVMLGNRDRWDIVDWMHDEFQEWTNPGNSRKPIPIEAILKAVGKTEEEIQKISCEASYYNRVDSFLSQ